MKTNFSFSTLNSHSLLTQNHKMCIIINTRSESGDRLDLAFEPNLINGDFVC